jgi:hypothetical protein
VTDREKWKDIVRQAVVPMEEEEEEEEEEKEKEEEEDVLW